MQLSCIKVLYKVTLWHVNILWTGAEEAAMGRYLHVRFGKLFFFFSPITIKDRHPQPHMARSSKLGAHVRLCQCVFVRAGTGDFWLWWVLRHCTNLDLILDQALQLTDAFNVLTFYKSSLKWSSLGGQAKRDGLSYTSTSQVSYSSSSLSL